MLLFFLLVCTYAPLVQGCTLDLTPSTIYPGMNVTVTASECATISPGGYRLWVYEYPRSGDSTDKYLHITPVLDPVVFKSGKHVGLFKVDMTDLSTNTTVGVTEFVVQPDQTTFALALIVASTFTGTSLFVELASFLLLCVGRGTSGRMKSPSPTLRQRSYRIGLLLYVPSIVAVLALAALSMLGILPIIELSGVLTPAPLYVYGYLMLEPVFDGLWFVVSRNLGHPGKRGFLFFLGAYVAVSVKLLLAAAFVTVSMGGCYYYVAYYLKQLGLAVLLSARLPAELQFVSVERLAMSFQLANLFILWGAIAASAYFYAQVPIFNISTGFNLTTLVFAYSFLGFYLDVLFFVRQWTSPPGRRHLAAVAIRLVVALPALFWDSFQMALLGQPLTLLGFIPAVAGLFAQVLALFTSGFDACGCAPAKVAPSPFGRTSPASTPSPSPLPMSAVRSTAV